MLDGASGISRVIGAARRALVVNQPTTARSSMMSNSVSPTRTPTSAPALLPDPIDEGGGGGGGGGGGCVGSGGGGVASVGSGSPLKTPRMCPYPLRWMVNAFETVVDHHGARMALHSRH